MTAQVTLVPAIPTPPPCTITITGLSVDLAEALRVAMGRAACGDLGLMWEDPTWAAFDRLYSELCAQLRNAKGT